MSSIYISKDTKCYIEEVKKKYKVLSRKELKEKEMVPLEDEGELH